MALTETEIKDLKEKAEVINSIEVVSFLTMIRDRFAQYVKDLTHGN